ncbi:MAG: hypothetical protein LBB91_04170 [Clostridiales bacterium]|jgi:hypothetical protein|nr:hypothetical protein [Clostridiales bacterium]
MAESKHLILENEFEAEFMRSSLQDLNIPFLITSFGDSAYAAAFQVSRGWGRLEIPPEHEAEVERIMEDMRKIPPYFTEESEIPEADPELLKEIEID